MSLKKILHADKKHRISYKGTLNLVVIALGSNLGNRKNNIQKAFRKIPLIQKSCASLYESKALLATNLYPHWNRNYLNTAMCGYCPLPPMALLIQLKKIESYFGRKKSLKWSPRVIDIDIIFYKKLKKNHRLLTIPHKETFNRDFVLIPIKELLNGFYQYKS